MLVDANAMQEDGGELLVPGYNLLCNFCYNTLMCPNLNNFIPDPHAHGIEDGDLLPSVESSTFRGEGGYMSRELKLGRR